MKWKLISETDMMDEATSQVQSAFWLMVDDVTTGELGISKRKTRKQWSCYR